jgi:hypothetical protein
MIRLVAVLFPFAAALAPVLRTRAVRREWLQGRTAWRPLEGWARASIDDVLAGRGPAFPNENKLFVTGAAAIFIVLQVGVMRLALPDDLVRSSLLLLGWRASRSVRCMECHGVRTRSA